jgi:HSP20 family molecular chaperone IbpA
MPNMVLTTRRDPFAALDSTLRRAFPATSRWTFGPVPSAVGFTPAADIVKDGDDALVRVELPGVDLAKDVTVEIDGGRLVIKGERRDEKSEDRDGRVLREMRYGSFRRVFTLPERVGADAVSASYDAGVLTVRVAGVYSTVEPQRISVTITPSAAAEVPTVEATTSGTDTPSEA